MRYCLKPVGCRDSAPSRRGGGGGGGRSPPHGSTPPCPVFAPRVTGPLTSGHGPQALLGLLVTVRGRKGLLEAGALYTALDLLSQHRRGAATFSKTEVSLLTQLKSELLHWDAVQQQQQQQQHGLGP